MKKNWILLMSLVVLNSCGIQTMTKIVDKTTNAMMKGVGYTLKGMDWAYTKAKGKINEDKIDGNWKIVALYEGDYETFKTNKEPKNINDVSCEEILMFDSKNKNFKIKDCKKEIQDKGTYTLNFEKINDNTTEYVNVFRYSQNESFNIININRKKMILEGDFIFDIDTHTKGVYVLEKVN